tara:strand:- start:356 stop:583 length:228 start_codon:yes stop_codon:yes gene_type:complete
MEIKLYNAHINALYITITTIKIGVILLNHEESLIHLSFMVLRSTNPFGLVPSTLLLKKPNKRKSKGAKGPNEYSI